MAEVWRFSSGVLETCCAQWKPCISTWNIAALRLGHFFFSAGGLPLSKPRFVEQVRSALARAGISTERYSGHSFRIGAATAAAEAGVLDSTIQALGRWTSSAFLTYIRTPRERLANWSSSMARV